MPDVTDAVVLAALARIEHKVDLLIIALADDVEEEEPARSLDGDLLPGERDQTQSL